MIKVLGGMDLELLAQGQHQDQADAGSHFRQVSR